LTLATCIRLNKPYQLIDAVEIAPVRAAAVGSLIESGGQLDGT
jgi:hypothetical protein